MVIEVEAIAVVKAYAHAAAARGPLGPVGLAVRARALLKCSR
jgi:hypothetical protein